MPLLRSAVAVSFAAVLCALAVQASADPPSWSGAWQVHERYHRPDGDGGGAPVPFAASPAAMTGAEDEAPVARGLPYGFNRGTCDRALLDNAGAVPPPVPGPFGKAMTAADRECLWGVLESLPDNRAVTWAAENGTLFRVRTERTYIKGATPCRDWRGGAVHPGSVTQTFGTYCRRSDGQWVSAQ
jgi:hypothetical protein